MKKFFLHLISSINAIVEINNKYIGIINKNGQPLSIEVVSDNPILLQLKPLQAEQNKKKLLPYFSKISLSGLGLVASNKLVNITTYKDHHYELFLMPNEVSSYSGIEVLAQKTFSINNSSHTATCFFDGLYQILIENNNLLLTHITNYTLTSCEIEKIKNTKLIIFSADTINGELYLLITRYEDNKYKIVKEEIINKLELEEGKITTLKKAKDIAVTAIIKEYKIENDNLTETDSYTVYLKEKAKTTDIPQIIPIAFLQAVKIKNYKLARTYLTEALNEKLADQHLEAYFGEFTEIKPARYEINPINKVALIYNENEKQTAKIFQVELINNKIANIDEA